jgi:sugar phosphate isomerase/epimerase
MYVAIRDVCLWQAGYNCITHAMAELELDGIELAVDRNMAIPSPDGDMGSPKLPIGDTLEAIAASEAFAQRGMHIAGLLLANNFNAPDRAAEINWAVQTVKAAEVLGADAVRVDAAMTDQQVLPFDERVAIFAGVVGETLDRTGDCTVPVAVENHGHQGNDPEWLDALLERLPEPRFGVTLDVANLYWAGHPLSRVYEIAAALAPRVRHVHCKNIDYPDGKREQDRQLGWEYGKHVAPVHQGDIDHARIIRSLAEVDYGGGLTIEDESLAKFESAERKRLLREQADCLAALAQEVGHHRCWSG